MEIVGHKTRGQIITEIITKHKATKEEFGTSPDILYLGKIEMQEINKGILQREDPESRLRNIKVFEVAAYYHINFAYWLYGGKK